MEKLNNENKGNWFSHNLHLSGDPKEITEIVSLLSHEHNNDLIDFSRIIPTPSEKELTVLGMILGEWNKQNYGSTKNYGFRNENPIVNDWIATLSFYTEDSPCLQLFIKLSEKYKNVEFHTNYNEALHNYNGTFRCFRGNKLCNLIDYKGYLTTMNIFPMARKNWIPLNITQTLVLKAQIKTMQMKS